MKYKPINISSIGTDIQEKSNDAKGIHNKGKSMSPEGVLDVKKVNQIKNNISDIKRLNTADFPERPSVLLVSQRRAGKSTALRSLLKEHGFKYDEIYVISQTAKFNNDYYFVKPDHIFPVEVMDTLIPLILNAAEEDILKKRRVERLIILDDVMGYVRNNDAVSSLFTRGRHFNISVFLVVQRISAVKPEIRNNSDIVMSALSKSKDVQDFFVNEFLSANFDKNEANSLFRRVTDKPFHFIVAENHKQTINPEDFIRYYYTDVKKPDLDIYTGNNQKITNKNMSSNGNNIINKKVKIKISDNNINGKIRVSRGKGSPRKGMGKEKGGTGEINVTLKNTKKKTNK